MRRSLRLVGAVAAALPLLVCAVANAAAQPSPPAAQKPSTAAAPTAPPAAPAVKPTELFGGASSLTETHGDWTVNCGVTDAGKACSVSQQQVNQTNRQRVLALELTPSGDRAVGVAALPFGLALGDGVLLAIDDAALGGPAAFRTCLPAGCLVPIAFDRAALAKLKTGTALTLTGKAADSGQAARFTVGLKGFGSALARAAELSKR